MSRLSNGNHGNGSPDLNSTIGFRLDAECRRELEAQAAMAEMSPHLLARQYVIRMLVEAGERAELRESIEALKQQVTALREDMVFCVKALLTSAGRTPEDQARAWVEKHFH